ncbi:MAG: hypothetical protein Q8R55_04165 [Candidatus Taylorbacteria bacterium]|nr:hypothetical protein [Candidatus Taylorbacteria bacterium]
MFKYLKISLLVFLLSFSVSWAVTKPDPDEDLNSLSYIFYLYYDAGQLFGDRDHEVKYDIINETFVAQTALPGAYKFEILNSKSEVVGKIQFDPRQGNPAFTAGTIQVKGPYAPNGQRAIFYNDQNKQLVSLFMFEGALCNDDDSCSLGQGENEKTCPSDCVKKTATPIPVVTPLPLDEGFDVLSIITYVVGGLLVVIGAWFGWKWWKKKKEESFLPPPPPVSPPSGPPNPPTPPLSDGRNLPSFR